MQNRQQSNRVIRAAGEGRPLQCTTFWAEWIDSSQDEDKDQASQMPDKLDIVGAFGLGIHLSVLRPSTSYIWHNVTSSLCSLQALRGERASDCLLFTHKISCSCSRGFEAWRQGV